MAKRTLQQIEEGLRARLAEQDAPPGLPAYTKDGKKIHYAMNQPLFPAPKYGPGYRGPYIPPEMQARPYGEPTETEKTIASMLPGAGTAMDIVDMSKGDYSGVPYMALGLIPGGKILKGPLKKVAKWFGKKGDDVEDLATAASRRVEPPAVWRGPSGEKMPPGYVPPGTPGYVPPRAPRTPKSEPVDLEQEFARRQAEREFKGTPPGWPTKPQPETRPLPKWDKKIHKSEEDFLRTLSKDELERYQMARNIASTTQKSTKEPGFLSRNKGKIALGTAGTVGTAVAYSPELYALYKSGVPQDYWSVITKDPSLLLQPSAATDAVIQKKKEEFKNWLSEPPKVDTEKIRNFATEPELAEPEPAPAPAQPTSSKSSGPTVDLDTLYKQATEPDLTNETRSRLREAEQQRYTRQQIEDLAREKAAQYNVPWPLVQALMRQESGTSTRANLVSSAGAIGPMQLMPGTAQGLGVNPYNIPQNIDGGIRYLKQQYDKYRGNLHHVLSAYNAGPVATDAWIQGRPYQAYKKNKRTGETQLVTYNQERRVNPTGAPWDQTVEYQQKIIGKLQSVPDAWDTLTSSAKNLGGQVLASTDAVAATTTPSAPDTKPATANKKAKLEIDTSKPGYFSVGDSHGQGVAATNRKAGWNNLAKTGASSFGKDFDMHLTAMDLIPRGSVVTLSLGANDLGSRKISDIVNQVNKAIAAGKERGLQIVYLLPTASPDPAKQQKREELRQALLKGVQDQAPIIDLGIASKKDPQQVHLNPAGYQQIGKYVKGMFTPGAIAGELPGGDKSAGPRKASQLELEPRQVDILNRLIPPTDQELEKIRKITGRDTLFDPETGLPTTEKALRAKLEKAIAQAKKDAAAKTDAAPKALAPKPLKTKIKQPDSDIPVKGAGLGLAGTDTGTDKSVTQVDIKPVKGAGLGLAGTDTGTGGIEKTDKQTVPPADVTRLLQKDQRGLTKAKRELSDFERAFAAARAEQGPGGEFTWTDPKTGKTEKFGTLYKGEKPPVSQASDQRQTIDTKYGPVTKGTEADYQRWLAQQPGLPQTYFTSPPSKIEPSLEKPAGDKDSADSSQNVTRSLAPKAIPPFVSKQFDKDERAAIIDKAIKDLEADQLTTDDEPDEIETLLKNIGYTGQDPFKPVKTIDNPDEVEPVTVNTDSYKEPADIDDDEDEIERIIKQSSSAAADAELKESINTESNAELHDILRLAGRL